MANVTKQNSRKRIPGSTCASKEEHPLQL